MAKIACMKINIYVLIFYSEFHTLKISKYMISNEISENLKKLDIII